MENGSSQSKTKKVLLIILGTILAIPAWYLAYVIVNLICGLILKVPFLQWLLFFRSEDTWITSVFPPYAAVSAGVVVSMLIGKTTKPFVILVILYHIAALILFIVAGTIRWPYIVEMIVSIGAACIMFKAPPELKQ